MKLKIDYRWILIIAAVLGLSLVTVIWQIQKGNWTRDHYKMQTALDACAHAPTKSDTVHDTVVVFSNLTSHPQPTKYELKTDTIEKVKYCEAWFDSTFRFEGIKIHYRFNIRD